MTIDFAGGKVDDIDGRIEHEVQILSLYLWSKYGI